MKIWSLSLGLLAAPIAFAAPAMADPPSQTTGACAIDLEGLPAGTVVTQLSIGAGINGCTGNGKVDVKSQNSLFSTNAAITFDTSCPKIDYPYSICNASDLDLGTPHMDFGGPGTGDGGAAGSPYQNDTPLGMVLVLARDKVDINNDGLVDDPDDADVPGSYDFDFTKINKKGVTINSVTIQDVEFAENESPAEISMTVPNSPPVVFTVVDTGNGGVAKIDQIGIENVTNMTVNVKGSSALSEIVFNEPVLRRACWATFGGFNSAFIGPEGDKIASFGGNVGPPPSGHLNIVKHVTDQHLRVFDVEVESCVRDDNICASSGSNSPGQPGGNKGFDVNVLNFVGTGLLDGVEVPVDGKLVDCGEPGNKKGNDPDQFVINADGQVFVAGPLDGGNVQLHPPVPNN
jgi:hypothetical protein